MREREDQVKIMGQIYRKAKVVVVFISEADEETEDVIAFLSKMAELIIELAPEIERGILHQQLKPLQADKYPRWDDTIVAAFKRFFYQPWFSQVWTFQEAVISRGFHVLCG